MIPHGKYLKSNSLPPRPTQLLLTPTKHLLRPIQFPLGPSQVDGAPSCFFYAKAFSVHSETLPTSP